MARLAIFLDGGYLDRIAEDEFTMRIDYRKLIEETRGQVAAKTPEPLDLLRTYYYHCLPYQSNPPTQDEARRYGQTRRWPLRMGRQQHQPPHGTTIVGFPSSAARAVASTRGR